MAQDTPGPSSQHKGDRFVLGGQRAEIKDKGKEEKRNKGEGKGSLPQEYKGPTGKWKFIKGKGEILG